MCELLPGLLVGCGVFYPLLGAGVLAGEDLMVNAPLDDEGKPGTWQDLRSPGKRKKANFTCPHGHTCDLAPYDILENGLVHPLVFCPGCGFHEIVILDGWMG